MTQELLMVNKKISIQGIVNSNEQAKDKSKLYTGLLGEYLKVGCGVS